MISKPLLEKMRQVPPKLWPVTPLRPIEVWMSIEFLAQVYQEKNGYKRLTVCRVKRNDKGDRWADGISWDELMELKRQCGFSSFDALEVFPNDKDIVNVANMRHLFIPPEPVSFAWRNK